MPSPSHDALRQMFSDRPQLAVEILRDRLGVDLPVTPLIREEGRTFNTRPSDDIEPDVVITLGPPQNLLHAIVVEVQNDKSKDRRQLARYAAAVWLLLRCDVTVLVVCPDRAAAAYYSQPIDSGLSGYRLQTRVLGPDGVPPIIDAQEAAANLEFAAMSVMIHGRERKVVEAFIHALEESGDEHAPQYSEYAYSMSAPEIRRLMEEIMKSTTWPVYSPFAREHYGRGRSDGLEEGLEQGIKRISRALLRLLDSRGVEVPDDARTRISACTDPEQLETWVVRAGSVQSAGELFEEPEAS